MTESKQPDDQGRLFEISIQKMKQGLCFFDADQRLIVANRRYAEIYGLPENYFRQGATLKQIVAQRFEVGSSPDADEAGYLSGLECLISQSAAADTTVRLRDGRTIAVHHEPIPGGGWVATHDDISALVDAQDRLAASEERYRALVEASASIFWRASADGSVLEMRGWEEATGQPAEIYSGWGWLAALHPDDRTSAAQICRDCVRTGQPLSLEYRLRQTNGEFRWVSGRGVAITAPDGCVKEWVGMVLDNHDRKIAEEAARAGEERLRLAAEATGLGIWDADFITGERRWSKELYEIVGLPPDRPVSREAFDACIHPDDYPRVFHSYEGWFRHVNRGNYENRYRIIRANDGAERWVHVRGKAFFDAVGQLVRAVGTVTDITDQQRASEELRRTEERLSLALLLGRMVAWEHDLRTGFVYRSGSAASVHGLASGPVSDLYERVHPDDLAQVKQVHANPGLKDTVEFRYVKPDGERLWLATRAGNLAGDQLIGITFDITERKLAEQEIWRTANHDALTGLSNRALFQQRFDKALAHAKVTESCVSLLTLDVDNFKDVNDTLGHDAGDTLLKEIAQRLRKNIRDCDSLARIGGDEFAILLVEPFTCDQGVRLAEYLADDLRRPFAYDGHRITTRVSIGVAAFPDHHNSLPDLMKAADLALYRAKTQGQSGVVAYTPAMTAASARRGTVLREIRHALEARQITPFYQPKVCLVSGRIVGFEALARWRHPTRGVLTPSYFGSAFAEPELAEMIGEVMLEQVSSDLSAWSRKGLDFGRVALNFSSAEFSKPWLAETVLRKLAQFGVSPSSFEAEITESVFLGASAEYVLETLTRFSESGVKVALDDFGTGFASLTHLKQYPVNHIKIDWSFVRGLGDDAGDDAIASAIIALAKSFRIDVTAEGIETEQQATRLRDMGCQFGQGYLYAKPMAASRVPSFLRQWPPLTGTLTRCRRMA